MRLDHLLSKEHFNWSRVAGCRLACSGTNVFCTLLMGGTFDNGNVCFGACAQYVAACLCGGWNGGRVGVNVFSGAHCWVVKAQARERGECVGVCSCFLGVVFQSCGITRVGGVVGTDRTLRTTQWTRASSKQ